MPFAICVKCGAKKTEAFALCGACQFDPARAPKELQAKSLWLSDEQTRPDVLESMAKQIKAGKSPSMDSKGVDAMMRQLTTQRNLPLVPKKRSLLIPAGALVLALAVAVAFLLS